MNDFQKIFLDNIQSLNLINKIVYNFRIQNYDKALRITGNVLSRIENFMKVLIENNKYFNEEYQVVDLMYITDMLTNLMDAQKCRDYIILADYFEGQIIPLINQIQEVIRRKEGFFYDKNIYAANIELLKKKDSKLAKILNQTPDIVKQSNYTIEYTSSGAMTLMISNKDNKYYMHSNNNPHAEADLLAQRWYDDEYYKYIVYGFGLGYHLIALLEQDYDICIKIYESDINILKAAFTFCDLSRLLNHASVQIIYDKDFTNLSKHLTDIEQQEIFLTYAPSLKNIKNQAIKDRFENYFLQYSSIKNQINLLNGNFRENIKNYNKLVDELHETFKDKTLYIIAAGPSLDKNIHLLKNKGEVIDRDKANTKDGIILATGTVFKKMINLGIYPDYLIVTDANPRVYAQISGVEDNNIPMILLSTAYKGFAQNYKGEKYIAFQKDFDLSEKYASEHDLALLNTGGSVSTTALDIGIQFECKRIVFLGLDLSYPNNFVHATMTSRRELASTEDLREVESIDGKMLYTNKPLSMYKEWIERRIESEKGIEFIDATEGGAKIVGMKIKKLEDVL